MSLSEKELKHIFITGVPASGKTTEAHRLEHKTKTPVLHGDAIRVAKGKRPGTKELRKAIKRLKDSHIIEGVQVMGLRPNEIGEHELRIIEPSRRAIISRLMRRGWNSATGTTRYDKEGAGKLYDEMMNNLIAFKGRFPKEMIGKYKMDQQKTAAFNFPNSRFDPFFYGLSAELAKLAEPDQKPSIRPEDIKRVAKHPKAKSALIGAGLGAAGGSALGHLAGIPGLGGLGLILGGGIGLTRGEKKTAAPAAAVQGRLSDEEMAKLRKISDNPKVGRAALGALAGGALGAGASHLTGLRGAGLAGAALGALAPVLFHKKDPMKKTGSAADTGKKLWAIAKKDPSKLKAIAKEMASGAGGQTAKGIAYGAAGYGALKGLGYRDPDTRKREPFEGAVRGAGKGALIGIPIALLLRYPALRRAVIKSSRGRNR